MNLNNIDLNSVEIEIINARYKDDIQGLISYALDKQGNELTQEQLDILNDSYEVSDYISELYWTKDI